MDQSLKSPGQHALEDAFHRLFELTRTEPAPSLAERLDRLARLRAAVSDNETRFEQAISADFSHRSTIETNVAETMLVLGEIRHATRSLKNWMAPKRVATSLQFFPAKNRLTRSRSGSSASSRLELSAAADAGARDRRTRRRQPSDDQAE